MQRTKSAAGTAQRCKLMPRARADAGLEGSADVAKRLKAWLAMHKEDAKARVHRVSFAVSLLAIVHESCADAGARSDVRSAKVLCSATLHVGGGKLRIFAVHCLAALSNASL